MLRRTLPVLEQGLLYLEVWRKESGKSLELGNRDRERNRYSFAVLCPTFPRGNCLYVVRDYIMLKIKDHHLTSAVNWSEILRSGSTHSMTFGHENSTKKYSKC